MTIFKNITKYKEFSLGFFKDKYCIIYVIHMFQNLILEKIIK